MFADGTCDCVKVVIIWLLVWSVAVCLLTVRVAVLNYYLCGNMRVE